MELGVSTIYYSVPLLLPKILEIAGEALQYADARLNESETPGQIMATGGDQPR